MWEWREPGTLDEGEGSFARTLLNLVRRWQPLARSAGYQAARHLGEELDQIALTSEGLGLHVVNGSALELAAYLCSFIDDQLVPNEIDLERLAGMVSTLGGALSELSGAVMAEVHSLHGSDPAMAESTAADSISERADGPLRLPRAACLLGDTVRGVPGFAAALRERGYEVHELNDIDSLVEYLGVATPGALLLDARSLRHLGRIRARLSDVHGDVQAMPALFVFSPAGDLGDRLLAMRAGTVGLFSAPFDSLRVIARVDEALMHTTQTPWRVLLAETDKVSATERARWLAERGMTVRLAANGQGALTALADFRPDVLVVDQELSDVHGLELIQLVRAQAEHAALPIVLMSASGDIGHRFDAIAAGSDDVLLKPVRARHLSHAIVSRMTRARWLRELIGVAGGRDARTGLYSRTVLIEKLAAASGDRSAALMCIAIDRAQALRDSIGLSGLAALDAHIGQVLRSQLDATDLARTTGLHYFCSFSRSRGKSVRRDDGQCVAQTRNQYGAHAISRESAACRRCTIRRAMVTNAERRKLRPERAATGVLWYDAKEAACCRATDAIVRAVWG